MWRLAVPVCLVFAVAAVAAEDSVMAAATGTPISVAGRPDLPVVSVTRVNTTMADDERIGEWRRGWPCSYPAPLQMNPTLYRTISQHLKTALSKEMESAGYRVQKKAESAFETEPIGARADYEVGAVIKSFSMNVCFRTGGLLGSNPLRGSSSINVKWELLNTKTQKVVFSVPMESSFNREDSERETIPEFYDRVLVAAARDLLANKDFVAAVTQPAAGPTAPGSAPALIVTKSTPAPGGTEKNSTLIRAAVVTVEAAASKGSAFYIDRNGYLLSAQHVVGESKFVKIRTATGREIPGEVLRIDARRDVALLKTDVPPFDPLAIRMSGTHVGEDVYCVGSPLGDTFSGSMTKGVISGDRDLDNRRFIQSDVAVLPGNSGGPLLDADGYVVGIASLALDSGRANLNLFVPINEALQALSIKVE
jgi:serine protease Do